MKVEDMGKFSFLGSEEEVHGRIFRAFRFEKRDGVLYVRMPFFFPDSVKPLLLKIGVDGDGWFVADDMGAAWGRLCARTGDATPYVKVLDSFCHYYCDYRYMEEDHSLKAYFNDARGFWKYIQLVSLAANADLYPHTMPDYSPQMGAMSDRWKEPGYLCPADGFMDLVSDMIVITNDEEYGTIVGLNFYFDGEFLPMSLRFMKTEQGITVTDFGGYDGGDLTDRLQVHCGDDLPKYSHLIDALCRRYGCDFSGQRLTFTYTDDSPVNTAYAAMHYLQIASIIGEIDHRVNGIQ